MKDFALILKNGDGQVFGITGKHILEQTPPLEGCSNRWRFEVTPGQTLEVIIVSETKTTLAVLAGHYREVLKAHVRRLGTTLSRI